ncbi:LCP family protein [Weissella tructae]|uniref:Transcriptional regulator n=2 Tax=Weissella TaxID=46255 RepID=A0A075TXV6_9LACO|nr:MULTISPECIES: LCP family protein [Weissella]AIG65171.1 Transcriptional regulator [Weissella tructae]AIM62484.1 Transcriptional regulator [Weissella ceti]AIM63820.1 Transcriptional regulator [Weissella ceti]ELA07958.1 transcriptional regulator [Weissella ceti NC36]QVV91556.1 LCP family protein [Weissella tructae]
MQNHPEQDNQRVSRVEQRGPRNHVNAYKGRHILFGIVIIAVVLMFLFGIRAYFNAQSAVNRAYEATEMKKDRDVSSLLKKGEPFSVLLLGTDTGELGRKYKGRTDSLMIATVNPKKETTTIVSIPRDTIIAPVGYEEYFPLKMNAAYEVGSAKTSMETVQSWLNVPVDAYILVNMGGLEKIVDELGGIKVASPLTFKYNPDTAKEDKGNLYSFTKGETTFQHAGKDDVMKTYHEMDGAAALAFSRMRYQDPTGDYGRQQRQRMVLEEIAKTAVTNPIALTSKSTLAVIGDSTKTDLSFGDIQRIAGNYVGAAKNIKTDNFTGQEYNNLPSGSSEFIGPIEKQRITNVLRAQLELPVEDSGPLYGGNVTADQINAYQLPLP